MPWRGPVFQIRENQCLRQITDRLCGSADAGPGLIATRFRGSGFVDYQARIQCQVGGQTLHAL